MAALPTEALSSIREEFRDAFIGRHPRAPSLANCGITRSFVSGTVQYQYMAMNDTYRKSELEQREDEAKRQAHPWRYHG